MKEGGPTQQPGGQGPETLQHCQQNQTQTLQLLFTLITHSSIKEDEQLNCALHGGHQTQSLASLPSTHSLWELSPTFYPYVPRGYRSGHSAQGWTSFTRLLGSD